MRSGRKDIREEGDRRITEYRDNLTLLRKEEQTYMDKFKEELPQYLEQKEAELCEKLSKASNGNITPMQIQEWIRPNANILILPKYTAEQMLIMFEAFRKMMIKINEKITYAPTKKMFCSFIGISTTTYAKYLNQGDAEMREVMLQIDDYVTDMQLSLAQNGQIKEITTIFRSKSEHGMAEAQAPQVVKHEYDLDVEKIKQNLSKLNNINAIEGQDYTVEH